MKSENDIMYKYKAFISYKHGDDKGVAKSLQKLLERFKPPKDLTPPNGFKSWKIFFDETDFGGGGKTDNIISENLAKSEYLIVLCSENYKKSRWCIDNECKTFKDELNNGSVDKIIPVVISGDVEKVLPNVIKKEKIAVKNKNGEVYYEVKNSNINAINISSFSKIKVHFKLFEVALKIAAKMLGCDFDKLYNRVKRRRRKRFISIGILIALLMIGLNFYNSVMMKKIDRLNYDIETDAIIEQAKQQREAGDVIGAVKSLLSVAGQNNSDVSSNDKTSYWLAETLNVFKATSPMHLYNLSHRQPVSFVRFMADGNSILTQDKDGVYLWNTATGEKIVQFLEQEKPLKITFFKNTEDSFVLVKGNETISVNAISGEHEEIVLQNDEILSDYTNKEPFTDNFITEPYLWDVCDGKCVSTGKNSLIVSVRALSEKNKDFTEIILDNKNSRIETLDIDISGATVLFTERENEIYSNVFIYDISNKSVSKVDTFEYIKFAGYIDNNNICMQTDREIFVYSLSENEKIYSYLVETKGKPVFVRGNVYVLSEKNTLIYSRENKFYEWIPDKTSCSYEYAPFTFKINRFKVSDKGKVAAEVEVNGSDKKEDFASNEIHIEVFDPKKMESKAMGCYINKSKDFRDFDWISDETLLALIDEGYEDAFYTFDSTTGKLIDNVICNIPYICSMMITSDKSSIFALCSDANLYKIRMSDYITEAVYKIDEEIETEFSIGSIEYIENRKALMLLWNETAYFINADTVVPRYKVDGFIDYNEKKNILAVRNGETIGLVPLYTEKELIKKANDYLR